MRRTWLLAACGLWLVLCQSVLADGVGSQVPRPLEMADVWPAHVEAQDSCLLTNGQPPPETGSSQTQVGPHGPYQRIPKGQLELAVDTRSRRLTVLVDGYQVRSYPVAVGSASSPSPVGEWHIVEKSRDWGGGFGTRWLGLDVPWGIYGIHGTNKNVSIGRRVSAGCIRMRNADVEELFELVPVGTRVTIFGDVALSRRTLVQGHRGADVREVQTALAKHGFSPGPLDGIFGPIMVKAVTRFQAARGLRVTGIVRFDTYRALGLGP